MDSYRKLCSTVYLFIATLCFLLQICLALDTLIPGKSIRTAETLISKGENFVLGFFNTSIPCNLYLGIWYYKVPVQTVVWVANRESPLTDSSGSLQIGNDGNLVILNGEGTSIWTTNVPFFAKNPVVKLLDSGNLIIIEAQDDDDGNNANFLWQGFDYPSDTFLPGMKIGLDHKTGRNRFLTSWRSKDDPSRGSFSLGLDHQGLPQLFLYGNSTPIFRSGPWIGDQSSVTPDFIPGFDSKLYFKTMVRLYFQSMVNFSFISNQDEVYYTYSMARTSIVSRLVIFESGIFQRFNWNDESKAWFPLWKNPTDDCASYEYCPSFASCNSNSQPLCSCLEGFEPRSVDEWSLNDFSGGCKRKMELSCNGDGFLQMSNIKFPDTSQVQVEEGLRSSDCEAKCLKSCNCTAYANANINGRVRCLIWSGNLTDLRDISNSDHHFYLRVAAQESGKKKKVHVTIIIVIIVGSIIFGLCSYFLWSKFKYKESPKKEGNCDLFLLNLSHRINASTNILNSKKLWGIMNRRNGPKFPVFDMVEISNATNNFSSNNKLGEGGFGVVYKGTLSNGREIAVKRLSKVSSQGLEEFKNEVVLTAKLQHRNLAQLLGCCIKEQEKMLVYEYMPNKSLDTILFDPNKRSLLDWNKRFHIIQGIARGLLYLHRDSTLRIIHRDLKASNILLDGEMNPKISDFGIARIFEGNQTQANTNKVIGTYGYMSPEYAMRGLFSVKSDVFSFGVLLLEIVSGRRNTSFYQCDHSLTLIGYAWRMWNENKRFELMDPILGDFCPLHEVINCIHVGLLCVQADAEDRPTMAFVVSMIENEIVAPPLPKEPAFSIGGRATSSSDSNNDVCSINDVTITMADGQ